MLLSISEGGRNAILLIIIYLRFRCDWKPRADRTTSPPGTWSTQCFGVAKAKVFYYL